MSVGKGIWMVNDVLTFGKHSGEALDEVIVEDPEYIAWCVDEVEGFELDVEAMNLLEASLRSK